MPSIKSLADIVLPQYDGTTEEYKRIKPQAETALTKAFELFQANRNAFTPQMLYSKFSRYFTPEAIRKASKGFEAERGISLRLFVARVLNLSPKAQRFVEGKWLQARKSNRPIVLETLNTALYGNVTDTPLSLKLIAKELDRLNANVTGGRTVKIMKRSEIPEGGPLTKRQSAVQRRTRKRTWHL